MKLRVLLADDHPIVRQGLHALLEREGFDVVAEAKDGKEALHLGRETAPDVAILDLSMPLLSGLEAARTLQAEEKVRGAVLLTVHREDHYVLEALRAGIRGYVLKSQAPEDIAQAVRQVAAGGVYLSPGLSTALLEAYVNRREPGVDPLSPRERQVLQLVAEGKSTKEVAVVLDISVKTADSHRTRLMKKLGIHETAGLVRYAIRRGVIEP